jgi:hypothetical protein
MTNGTKPYNDKLKVAARGGASTTAKRESLKWGNRLIAPEDPASLLAPPHFELFKQVIAPMFDITP